VAVLTYLADPRPVTVLWILDIKDRDPVKNGVIVLTKSAVLIYLEVLCIQVTVL
jgi:hypothetical protein